MNTSALLGQLIAHKRDYNYVIQQHMKWKEKYNGNQQKLNKQVKADDQWHSKYEDAINPEKEIKYGGQTYTEADAITASKYADSQVRHYNSSLSEELAALDVTFDSMNAMFEAYEATLKAQIDSEKSIVQQACQDTGLISQ